MSSFRLAWLTDIHLDFLKEPQIIALCERILSKNPSGIFLTGDISIAPRLESDLQLLAEQLHMPIYFVLGNHDFYRGSIRTVRNLCSKLSTDSPYLHWLPASGIIPLAKGIALLGHDGWGDGRSGNGGSTEVLMSDFFLIEEMIGLSERQRFHLLNRLGDEAALHIQKNLAQALLLFPKLILLTHVPPFQEACQYAGRLSHPDYLPHFVCKAVGDVVHEFMSRHPENHLTILCGHTHTPGEFHILPNLTVKSGLSEYGHPDIVDLIEITE